MAANYSQYTDHNEIGGVSVGLEDAKLAAADSVDEVTATDCVLMKDASGNPVKILKEDFNEAVRDALGSILSKSELGTSIGRVAALRSSDNDFGSISTSDLASVLGVSSLSDTLKYYLVPIDDPQITGFNITDEQLWNAIANYVNGTVNESKVSILNVKCYEGARFTAIVSQNGRGYGSALVFSWYMDGFIKIFRASGTDWTVKSIT